MTAPQSPTDGVTFDLEALADELRAQPAYAREGQAARTLVRTHDLRVVLIALDGGKSISEHHADATASVQALSGRLRLTLPDRTVEISAGQLLVLGSGLSHDVHAIDESAFVLTLGWSGERK